MSHENWRNMLPYYIAKYKGQSYTIKEDKLTYWYRDAPVAGGSSGTVVGNNANQGQTEVPAATLVSDKIFFTALLKSEADVMVQIGANPAKKFKGKKGLNNFSQAFGGQTGVPQFSIMRTGQKTKGEKGRQISPKTQLGNGLTNFNAYVGGF